jgi:steroid delta-isomerase-like uncharacterized protein
MSTEENKAIVRRFVEAFNTGNPDIVDETVATDFVLHDPGLPEDLRGPEGAKQWVNMFHTGFPDIHVTIEDLVAEGDKVAKKYTCRGTHKGEFAGIPPTGNQVAVPGISIYRIAGGKIAELWMSYDSLGTMQQLGVVPPPGQGEE